MNVGWLVVALGVVVLGIGGYTFLLVARRRTLEKRIEEFSKGSKSSRTES